MTASVWMSLALIGTSRVGLAQDDGPIGQVNQGIAAGNSVSVDEQRELGLVTVNGGCSGTLLNQYWVLTAEHCVSVGNLIGAPLVSASTITVTAAWSAEAPVATRLVTYTPYGLDVALIYLGDGDFGPVNAQPLFVGQVDTTLSLQKYGQGLATFASAGPPPSPATGSGTYRTAQFVPNASSASGYTLPMNSSSQVGHGGDSGGPDIVTYAGVALGIAGVQSTCISTGTVPGMGGGWAWSTGISSCYSAAIEPVRWEIQQEIQAVPRGEVYVALSSGTSFGVGEVWVDGFCTRAETCEVGDVNGDGLDDVIRFVKTNGGGRDSDVWVALSDGYSFAEPQKWQDYFCTLNETCAVADVNGDGFTDLVSFVKTNGGYGDSDVWVALSDGYGFGTAQKWHDYFCTRNETCAVGDMNGDGMDDLVSFVKTNGGYGDSDVWVSLSTGYGFGTAQKWADYFCTRNEICAVADVNGDGRDDVLAFARTTGGGGDSDVYVALSTAIGFSAGQKWADYFCTGNETCEVGDVNGDGDGDAVAFVKTNGGVGDSDVWVGLSGASAFSGGQKWQDWFCTLDETCALGDVDGDGRDDAIAFVRGD